MDELLSCLLKGQGTADTVLPYAIKVLHILHWGKTESITLLFYSSKKISETLSRRTWTGSCLASLDTFYHTSLPWICDILKKVFKKGWRKRVEYCSSQGACSLKRIIQITMRWFLKHNSYSSILIKKNPKVPRKQKQNRRNLEYSWQSKITFTGKWENWCRGRKRERCICLSNKGIPDLGKAKHFLEESYTMLKDQIYILGSNISSFFLLQRLTNLSTGTFLSKILLFSSLDEKPKAVIFSQMICWASCILYPKFTQEPIHEAPIWLFSSFIQEKIYHPDLPNKKYGGNIICFLCVFHI